ncbi:hypothetical protein [Clostridioides difficile]|uniref:hypothetical protein n=1 Tax=Clostridioides difficile TaxID=1496 RepID=UPI000BD61368|nr:hypothetical protein [Clostridioides difficile]PBF30962.1 hypothetical protein BGU41_00265 [Clostridioides difficile]
MSVNSSAISTLEASIDPCIIVPVAPAFCWSPVFADGLKKFHHSASSPAGFWTEYVCTFCIVPLDLSIPAGVSPTLAQSGI